MSETPWRAAPFACWPPCDCEEPPAEPLRVDAGPDDTVATDTPLTLAGSASGGTPPYVFEWVQVSGPGVATFVDDTDPTTDVSFDVAGSYVLQLNATDAVGTIAGDRVTETVTAAAPKLLDTLSVQPLFAGCLGVQLRNAATAAFRVRRTLDDAEQDIGFSAGEADLDALATFCGAGNGFVVKLYNQSLGGGPAALAELDSASQMYCYAEGSPVLGATGKLAARRDLVASGAGYEGALAMLGDVAVTLTADVAPQVVVLPAFPYYASGLRSSADPGGFLNAQWFCDSAFAPSVGPYIEVDADDSAAVIWGDDGDGFPAVAGWFTFARSAGDDLASSFYQYNGAAQAMPQGTGGAFVPNFTISKITWVAGDAPAGWGSQSCKAGFIFVFDVDESTLPADLAKLNAFGLASHA